MLLPLKNSPNQLVSFKYDAVESIHFSIKREDNLHPHISGNKYRKLRYNIQQARIENHNTLLTFGGAYSNHIAATAAAASEFGFKSIGIIRGDELKEKESVFIENPTLNFARSQGMVFKFVSRTDYRRKEQPEFIESLKHEFGDFYHIPQGGTNHLAVKGCEEILSDTDENFDIIAVAIGTGGTISGILNSAKPHQKVMGFPALKDDFLENEIKKYTFGTSHLELIKDYHFGGFAKVSDDLVQFINNFKEQTGISLDPIYTGKMVFGIVDLFSKKILTNQNNILVIHTGGLQGIEGMNQRLLLKKKTTIQ